MEHYRNFKRYNMTLVPATKEAAMKLMTEDETLSGLVQEFLEDFITRRKERNKKKRLSKKNGKKKKGRK